MRPRCPTMAWLPLCLVACGTALPPAPSGEPAVAASSWPLPAGTIVRLLRTTADGVDGTQTRDLAAIDGWWRAAMRQSIHLDVAAPPDDGADLPGTEWRLALTLDVATRTLLATLGGEDGPPLVLASATFQGPDLPTAIDRLAQAVRSGLGETDAAAVAAAACVSTDPLVAAAVEQASESLALGDLRQAIRDLERARRRDGGSPAVLDLLASARALRGDAAGARALATEALALNARLSPVIQHRLLRTLLLARAVAEPATTADCDRELATLAAVAQRERPHDPQVQLTAALAANLRGDFAAALPGLQALRARLPGNATVLYHLGFAELAAGDPRLAMDHLAAAAPRLPFATTLQPRAIALFEAGATAELRELLANAAADPDVRAGSGWHEVVRMQAAHALLCGDAAAAGELLLADLAWLLQHPVELERRAGDLADAAEVLVRIGRAEAVTRALAALPPAAVAVADAAAYGAGLAQVATSGERAAAAEAAPESRRRERLERRTAGVRASAAR
ncbi:MAG: hypothetical protein IPK26_15400 [Planctomycetes bacterium]|nr:hypothetical protein [Planctomycetota bacterium]